MAIARRPLGPGSRELLRGIALRRPTRCPGLGRRAHRRPATAASHTPTVRALKQRAVAAYTSQLMRLDVGPTNPVDCDAFVTRLAAESYWRRLHPGSPAHQHSRRMTIDQNFMRLLDV